MGDVSNQQVLPTWGTSLDRHRFKCAVVAATGWKPSRQNLEAILGLKVPKDAKLSREQLLHVVKVVVDSRDATARLREMYQAFDTAGLGFIRRTEALRIFKNVAPSVRSYTVEEAFNALDASHSGRVSCDDFMCALKGRLV